MLRPTVSRPVYTAVKPHLVPKTRFLLLSDSCAFRRSVDRSVKLVLAFVSTVITVFSLLEIHCQAFYSLLDMHVFRNRAFSLTREGSIFLCSRYICCTLVSARVYIYKSFDWTVLLKDIVQFYPLLSSIPNVCMHRITVILLYRDLKSKLKYFNINFKISLKK
jgi:hypothetical protein